ncbi:Thioesterase superfamily protein (fragment) [Paraburkholderia piptadeniae]|uniref:Thioesterase superfamily protein n=1 Tax=Paraburkholderia piptadeniae TaxID=1701573 RepID=A0A1N7RKC6_9BURK
MGVVRARFLKRSGGTVPTNDLLQLAGVTQASPVLPEWVVQWNAAEAGMTIPPAAREASAQT